MANLWPNNRGYLELFAGSGLALLDDKEFDGCPLIAALCEPGFTRLAFVEFNPTLYMALEERLLARGIGPDRARVFLGDANDPDVLAEALAFLPAPGLIFAFVDPEDINGRWDAIRFLASSRRDQHIDFLINLPIGSMKRNYSAKGITAVLGTDSWQERVRAGEPLGLVMREIYAQQFRSLGFRVAEHEEIRAVANNAPLYDLVFASRSARGLDFWRKAMTIEPSGQRRLF